MSIGNPKSVSLQTVHERRHDASSDKLTDNLAVFDAALLKLKDRLSGDRAAFHSGNFSELDHLSAAIAQPSKLDDDIDGGGCLLAQRSLWQCNSRHEHHRL